MVLRTALTLLLLLMPALAAAKPYALANTDVVALRSKETGADYELFIALPSGYAKSTKQFPVVYMLDADDSFALVRNVVRNFTTRGHLPEMILVAIAYPGAGASREIYMRNRTRDYTPVFAPDGGYGATYQSVSGGGPKFRAFVATELAPYIEQNFRVDPADRTLIGHSYGGLFATYVLLTEPALFKRYIIVSPSLWYANRIALTMEEAAAAAGRRPEARVFFAVGSLENQPANNRAMVDDLSELVAKLKSRNNPRLFLRYKIYDGETHISVFPGAVTRGLLTVFEGVGAN